MSKNLLLLLTAATLIPAIAACGVPEAGDGDCSDGKCDDPPDSEVEATVCDGVMVDRSGKGFKKVAGRLNDPLAKAVFRTGDKCPTSYRDIMAKLRQNDKDRCAGEKDGIVTRLISETAQASGKATSYRAVTTRTCAGRDTHEIIFSLFGLRAGATSLPSGVEIIAFDKSAGVFNYYETTESGINFFGNSKDMLKGKGDGDDRRCAGCHTGGGLIMKELDTPWLHWEGHLDHPGATDLVNGNKDLGSKTSGAELEGVVKNANRVWNKTRIDHVLSGDTVKLTELLKPLFCPVEVNLDNGADFQSPIGGGSGGSEISSVPFDSLLDPQLKGFGSIPITFSDYDSIIKSNGQRVQGLSGAVDTVFDYVFIERSNADNDYVSQLKSSGILDDDLIKDVLMVDFTRHVFSDDRCGLLSIAPELPTRNLKADDIRNALVNALESENPGEGSPGAVLLANLKNKGDANDHNAKVDAFINACKGLGSRSFLENAIAITSLNRNIARERPVFEFEQTMPTDNLSTDRDARLDPKTCQLTNSFVAP